MEEDVMDEVGSDCTEDVEGSQERSEDGNYSEWLPKVESQMERIEELLTSYQENQCIVQIGASSVKAGSMQALLHGAEVTEEV
jgi:hypothetical protein